MINAVRFILYQHAQKDFFSASSMEQPKHIILIPSEPGFALFP
jgi:hypothetical protein